MASHEEIASRSLTRVSKQAALRGNIISLVTRVEPSLQAALINWRNRHGFRFGNSSRLLPNPALTEAPPRRGAQSQREEDEEAGGER